MSPDDLLAPAQQTDALQQEIDVPAAPTAWFLLPGVLLPSVTVAIEAATHMCAEALFDPIPTSAHLVLASAVPLVNLFVWWRLRTSIPEPRSLAWLLGAAAGVSALYALAFLPILPLALFATFIMGIGLLPLAPHASLVFSLVLLRVLRRWSSSARRTFAFGMAAGCVLLIALEAPGIITSHGLSLAASADKAEQQRGFKLLRALGSRDEILNRCYWQSGRTRLPGLDSVSPIEARKVFYRLTGETFDAVPASRASAWARRTLDWDPDVGGTAVGQRLRGLSLNDSRVDGSVDAKSAIAYLEWTMSFRNANATVQEARAQVQLPPDAVVSRVTLWVNGEEREAAFGSRGQVRQAYQRVVSARRDPLLVTTSGPGRVLVQCFPVPANGEMKIRIGITAPLYQRSQLLLPQFVERNFRVGEEHKHSIWMESTGPIQAAGLESAQDGSVFRLRGESAALPVIAVQAGEPNQVWARDERRTGWIGGRPIFVKGTKPRKVAVVVDASAGLAQHKDAIARALPPGVRVFAAGDDVVRSDSRLNGVEFHGGIDSVPALVEAHRSGADAIVWIHGLQPETFMPAGVLLQYRQRGNTPLYVVAAQSGPNRIAEALDALAIPVPGTGSLQRDLENLFRNWDGGWRWEFERRDAAPAGAPITSAHLGRLWAASEVRSLLAARRNDEAGQLAAQYQLVTPASGAVVLENQRQYDENNLKPADPLSVPTVPEPETWMLMALAAVLLMASRRRNLWPRHS